MCAIQAISEVAEKYKREGKNDIHAKYAAMVESVDDAAGRVMETLERLQLTNKTLVIFTSDNGGLRNVTDNSPLRSGKGYPFEVQIPEGEQVHGFVLTDQVKSLDWRVRKAKRVCTVPDEIMEETIARILALVDPVEAR